MRYSRTFGPHDSVIDLIAENYNILPILSRMDIPLGFGDKTVAQVCRDAGIELPLFLTVVNFIMTGSINYREAEKIEPAALVDFLQRSHQYFIDYKFPHIRSNLAGALEPGHPDLNAAIMEFFDNFVEQVRRHFAYEESTVFPYIRALQQGHAGGYSIDTFRQQHEEVGRKMGELKQLILQSYVTTVPNRMYDVLVDICNCEEDLDTHADIENHILIPLIANLEEKLEG